MLVKWLLIFIVGTLTVKVTYAAEWKAKPSLDLTSMYNDNVGMRSTNEESSTGYTIAPSINLNAQEPNWDVGMSALVKATRYNGVEDVDSDNYFFTLANGYSTERHTFRLDGSFSRNNTYDTDYDTQLPGAELFDDHTEVETRNISPAWQWSPTETSSLSFKLSSTDVDYHETTSDGYRDYSADSASIQNIWAVGSRSQLGFTLSYTEYKNDEQTITVLDRNFVQFLEYKNSTYQLDYAYSFSETSKLKFSFGRHTLDSVSHNEYVGCLLVNPFAPQCIVPDLQDVERSDDGTVVSLDYSSLSEVSTISANINRTVSPSSYGGAQIEERASVRYRTDITERLQTDLILETEKTASVGGLYSGLDRKRHRFEPKVSWKLRKYWSLGVSYRYIKQILTTTDTDSESNAIYVNLTMSWPRLASTY